MNLFIIGSGAWGTALGVVLAHPHRVTLWTKNQRVSQEINTKHTTPYLPNIHLPKTIHATSSMEEAQYADFILIALPVQSIRLILTTYKEILKQQSFVLCSKGFEEDTQKAVHEILQDIFPNALFAVLCGPNFAHEIAQGLPAAYTLASYEPKFQKKVAEALTTHSFRPELSNDVIGLEVLSSFKNVLAFICGIARALLLGENAIAMIITHGIRECIILLTAYGGKKETILTMGGIGDILLTCTSQTSRNASFGFILAKHNFFQKAYQHRTNLAESIYSTKALFLRTQQRNLSLPILETAYTIIEDNTSAKQAIEILINTLSFVKL